MAFFSKNLYYIKFFSEMYYHVFSTKADQEGGSIHEKNNPFPEIHILVKIEICNRFSKKLEGRWLYAHILN